MLASAAYLGGSAVQRAATKSMNARVRAGNCFDGDHVVCKGQPDEPHHGHRLRDSSTIALGIAKKS